MTKREGAVLSAFTGKLLCEFGEFQKYIEEILGRPVYTHEIPQLEAELKEKSRDEAMQIICKQN